MVKEKDSKLTKRQKEILDYIKKFSATKKYPPSIREIAANFNLSSPATAHVHVNKLIEKGYLKNYKYLTNTKKKVMASLPFPYLVK